MKHLLKNQHGVVPIMEIILVVAVLTVAGVAGYLAYQHQKPVATNATPTPSPSVSPRSATKYLTIKEWGVRAPYTGADELSYTLGAQGAAISSKELTAKEPTCVNGGAGLIQRFAPSDHPYPGGDGPTADQYAVQYPGELTHIGSYYYMFVHDQAACGTNTSDPTQSNANNLTKALVSKLEAIPAQ